MSRGSRFGKAAGTALGLSALIALPLSTASAATPALASRVATTLARLPLDGPTPSLTAIPGARSRAQTNAQNGTIAIPDIQSETTIAASGSLVVVGFNDFRGAEGDILSSISGVIYSSDGGQTFTDGGQLPASPGSAVLGDPVLAVYEPPSGPPVFYYSSIFSPDSVKVSLCIHRSTDGGASWSGPFEVTSATSSTDALEDKEWCTVDPETGRLFVSWTRFPPSGTDTMKVTYSDDGGVTWSTPFKLGTGGQGSVVACDPNGPDVYVAWETGAPAIAVARSSNNGASWNAASTLSAFSEVLPPYGFDRLNSFPSLAVNPADHGVELVYAASVNGTPSSDFGDIYYRRSTNHASGFSPAVALNVFHGSDRPQIFPTVATAPDGRVDVFWYDESAGSGVDDLTDLFYTFSTTFGASWSSPVPVTPAPFHNEAGNNYTAPHQGDYIDATSGGPARSAFAWFGTPSPFGSWPDALVATIADPVQVAPLRVRPGSITLSDFGCTANDGALVAGEAAYLTIPLENIGRGTLTGIAGTLTSLTPGVTVYASDETYPSLASGSSAPSGRPYFIRLANNYPCGTPARFLLDVSASGVAPAEVELTLPTGVISSRQTLLSENFDSVTPPALPAGWSNFNLCSGCPANSWVTTTVTPASPPNAVFCLDNTSTTFGRLSGPTVAVPANATYVEISFDTSYNLEAQDARTGFDAFSFGYAVDGSGTHFATADAIEFDHRYTDYIDRGSGNGRGDRSGWSGDSGGYHHVRARIPGLAGHSLEPRFDLTTDSNTGLVGATMDNVLIEALIVGCGSCTPLAEVEGDPRGFGLRLAGPSPFSGGTSLRYSLSERAAVRLEVFNVAGRRVRTLVDRVMEPGSYDASLASRATGERTLAPGVYWVRLAAGGRSRTLRVITLK